VALMVVSSGKAQPPATNAWRSIVFSSPDNTQISSNLVSHPPQPPSSPSFQGRLRIFEDASPVAAFNNLPLPGGPAPVPGLVRRQTSSEDSRGWEFMTPAEIMGVAPGQILQNQKGETSDGANSLTPLERLLEGQNPSVQGNSSSNLSLAQNVWADGGSQTNDALLALFSSSLGNLQSNISGPFTGSASANNPFAGPIEDSSWSQLLGLPSPSSSPNFAQQQQEQQQQQEKINQFMQLINPGSTPATTATTVPNATSFTPQPSGSDSDSTEPLADPVGASFAPLSSDLSKPATWAPLPTITRQVSAQPVAPPAWVPQPPPWLSTTPQPFAIPQRKF